MSSLATALPEELKRNRELKEQFLAIGPPRTIGAMLIEQDIQRGEKALASGDVIEIVKAYEKLKENQD